MSPMRPRSSSASSTPVAGKKEKTATEPGGGARNPPKRRSTFACKACGKRFPSQQAMAGHCSAHTRTAAARRIVTAARQLLPPPQPPPYPASSSSPLPVVAVTVRLAVLFWPLTPVQLSLPLRLPPSQITCRWPPGSLFPKSSLLSPSPTTGEPASRAMVDVTLRLGCGGKRRNEKPPVESPMLPNLHGHRGEQGRDGKRARGMDGCDHGRKKGKGQMDGLDLELRLHR